MRITRYWRGIGIFLLIITMSSAISAGDGMLQTGQKAPEFSLKDSNGEMRTLDEFYGSPTVIYFYPKDDTPGCTKEACSFRDNYSLFESKGIQVVGISYDSPESHTEFKEKYNLPFTLLSDSEKTVAEKYGANRGLLDFVGAKRISYLLDKDGIIIKVYPNVTPADHAGDILEEFNEISSE